jgi:hypothetical protein
MELRGQNLRSFLQLRNGRFLFLHFAMLVEQHCGHRFVAHGVDFSPGGRARLDRVFTFPPGRPPSRPGDAVAIRW